MRPAVGATLRRCPSCGGWQYGGAPECPRCADLVDAIVEDGWREFLHKEFWFTEAGFGEPRSNASGLWNKGKHGLGGVGPGRSGTVVPDDERDVAEMVADEPDRHDWRVYDAAIDRLTCDDCGGPLGRRFGCPRCDLAHGFRYAAVETDRPGVPRGNEHAIRVNVSVVRRPEGVPAPELLTRRLILPALLSGFLPTIAQAQHLGALAKRGATAEELVHLLDSLAETSRVRPG